MNRPHLPLNSLFIILFMISIGCSKYDGSKTETVVEEFESLTIADAFNWNTTTSLQINVYQSISGVIKITSLDGSTIYHKGYFDQIEDYYSVQINIPSYVEKLVINGQTVEIMSDIVDVYLDLAAKSVAYGKSTNAADNLVAQWSFDENQGSTASDGYADHDGTINGAEWVTGISGSALQYNGINGKTLVPYDEALDFVGTQLSHSLWFKLDHVGDYGCFMFQNVKYIIRIDNHGKILFGLYNPTWSQAVIGWDDRVIDTDWHHLVTTYDGAVMKMYLDGELMSSTSTSGNINASNADLYIGNQSSTNFFNGQIDEVVIYRDALTQDEVTQLFQNTPNPDNGSEEIISEWLFNEGSGSIAIDSQSNNNGTVSGATYSEGVTGSALTFDGEDDYVIIPSADNLSPVSEISIMAWAKTNENATAKIAQKGDWDGHGIFQDKWNGWKCSIRTADNSSHSIYWDNGVPMFDEWYHVCMTYDGSVLKLFVNGQLKSSEAVSGNLKVNSRNFSIGSDNGSQKFFNGSIDDVRFYGSALSQTQIQAVFNNQSVGDDSDGDGVADSEDDYPDDPARAFKNLYPANGYASLAFEDLWPGTGDYDFNDLVVDYQFTQITNVNNKVTDLNGRFVVRAIGAGFINGFGFQLDSDAIASSDLEVTGSVLTQGYVDLNDQGTEAAQEKVTFIVFDNAYAVLPSAGGFGVNVESSAAYVEPDTIQMQISFSNLGYTIEDLNLAAFNPFLMVNEERGREVHLPGYKPTSLADNSYFGTMQDNTNAGLGVYYKTDENLPWALHIAESYEYTLEKVEILDAYNHFAAWAQSSGVEYPDWYHNENGYRDESLIYDIP